MNHDIITADWFNSLSDDEKKRVFSEGLDRRIHEAGLNYAVPIWWVTLDQQSNAQVRNGSAFQVDCGHGVFAVTAAHVFEEYRLAKSEAAQIVCQIGGVLFDPIAQLINCRPDIDLATFRLSDAEAIAIGKQVVAPSDGSWPPLPPEEGNFAFFAGFPALSRASAPEGLYTVPYLAMTPISRITDRQITCRFNREKWIDTGGHGLPPEGYDIGGVSGGPLLIPTLEAGNIAWRLGGIVVEAAGGTLFEQVVAVRAHYLLPDGQISG